MCLIKVFEISNDDIAKIFEVVLFNHKRYYIKKMYDETSFKVVSGLDTFINFNTVSDALEFINKREKLY